MVRAVLSEPLFWIATNAGYDGQAVIDQVEVKRVRDLSPREIEHDNPEFRRVDEMVHFLEQIYGRKVSMDDTVTVVRFSQIIEQPPEQLRDRIHGLGGARN